MATYSIVQVNINNYDQAFSNQDKDSTENLLFTDKHWNINGWKQIMIPSNKERPFNDVFKYRWNVLDYINTDYVIWIDGSKEIKSSLKPHINEMEKYGYEFAIKKHCDRDNIFDEYQAWIKYRQYDKQKAFNWLKHMEDNGLDIKHSGLSEASFMIMKRCDITKNFLKEVWSELHYFDKENVERLDQTVAQYILKTKFNNLKAMFIPEKYLCQIRSHWNHPLR